MCKNCTIHRSDHDNWQITLLTDRNLARTPRELPNKKNNINSFTYNSSDIYSNPSKGLNIYGVFVGASTRVGVYD